MKDTILVGALILLGIWLIFPPLAFLILGALGIVLVFVPIVLLNDEYDKWKAKREKD